MAILREPRPVSKELVRVQGANNGDYGILIVPDGKKGITVGVSGTAASGTVVFGRMVGAAVQSWQSGTVAVGEEISITSGVGAQIFATVASATATTDLYIDAYTWA